MQGAAGSLPDLTARSQRITVSTRRCLGERLRLKAEFDVSGFSPEVRTILDALKRYGMFVADNGIQWPVSVAPDPRIPNLHEDLRRVKGSAFEVVVPPN